MLFINSYVDDYFIGSKGTQAKNINISNIKGTCNMDECQSDTDSTGSVNNSKTDIVFYGF